jgi:hypothetical protein
VYANAVSCGSEWGGRQIRAGTKLTAAGTAGQNETRTEAVETHLTSPEMLRQLCLGWEPLKPQVGFF